MKRSPLGLAGLVLVLALLPHATMSQQTIALPTISIAADKVKARISPTLYGLMTEEISFSYEGGLYGELIRNRSFKGAGGFAYNIEEPVFWTPLGGANI